MQGEIKEVIIDEKAWKKMSYWYVIIRTKVNCRPEDVKQKEESDEED